MNNKKFPRPSFVIKPMMENCEPFDLFCRFTEFFKSLFSMSLVPNSLTCNFTPQLQYDPKGEPYLRGQCVENNMTKECISISYPKLQSLCSTECHKQKKEVRDAVCYKDDVICRCK